MKEGRYDNGEMEEIEEEKTEDEQFQKFIKECEEEKESDKESVAKAKSQKQVSKMVSNVLKKLGAKMQKLVTGVDLNEEGITGEVINLLITRMQLAQLIQEDKTDENTIMGVFEKTWSWDEIWGKKFIKQLDELKDQRGLSFNESEKDKKFDEFSKTTLKEQIQEEFVNFYNKKV
jgi:hypothetical protein